MSSAPRVIAAARFLAPALLLLTFSALSDAQDSLRVEHLRLLTNELMRVNGGVAGRSRQEIRQKRLSLIRERADLLYRLIAENPSQAVELSFLPEVADRLRAEFPEAADRLDSQPSLKSTIVVFIEDNIAPKESRTFVQMQEQRGKPLVYFASKEPSGLKSGDVLRVRGLRIDDHIAAVEAGVVQSASTASAAPMIGDLKTAILMVNFPGVPVPPLSIETVRSVFFSSTQRSLDGYWRENSYNLASTSGGVFGSYTLDRAYSCDEVVPMWNAAIQAADADVDFRVYSHFFVIFPTIPNCWFTGIGTLGAGNWNSPRNGPFSGAVAWEPSFSMNTQDGGVSLSAHEGGHGLGLAHSRERTFSGQALGPVGMAGSTIEYGDPYAAMAYNPGHYAAPHKALLGWLVPGSGYSTIETSGVFTIDPIETVSSGTKALKVRRGTGNNAWLWIEYRQPVGSSDILLQGPSFSGAVVHYEDSTTLNYTDILDFTPQTSTSYDAPLASWSDPYSDLTVLVLSATSTGLTVSVQYGSQSSCSLVIPSVSLASSSMAAPPGGTVDYTVTVQNNDTAACLPARTFTLTSPQPNGWGTTFTSSTATLASQQSTTVTVTKSVPAGTATGVSIMTVVAADSTNSGSATASVVVSGSQSPQPVSVTPSGGAGNPVNFIFAFSDPAGYTDILSAAILFNTSVSFQNVCHVLYEPGNNRFFLADDGETTYLGPVALGSFGIVENSQCRISGAGSWAYGSGTDLTLTLAIAFKTSFPGTKNIYMEVQNYFLLSGWQQMGSWTITAPQLPAAASAPSPGDGTAAASLNPVLSWTAGAGAQWYDVYFGTSASPPFAVSTSATTFSAGTLSSQNAYFWRIVASSAAGAISSPVWSFTTAAGPDFSLAVAPAAQSWTAGGSAQYITSIGAFNGFADNVSLAVTGLPAGATVAFSPNPIAGAGSSTLTVTTSAGTPPGTYTAQVTGTSGVIAHTASLTLSVQVATAVSLAAAGGPFAYGQPVPLTATITPAAAAGAIQFTDGTTPLGTANISGGSATLTVASLSVGTHQINAAYVGGSIYLASNAGLTIPVSQATSNTALMSSPNAAGLGQTVTFTATVSSTSALGSVQFLDGTTSLGIVTLSGGTATLTLSSLTLGTHSITGSYSGDANNAASTSAVLTQTIVPAPPQPVSVTPSSGTGNPATFTFLFSDSSGAANILSAAILFNTSIAFQNACHVLFEPGNNRFFLANDGETTYLGPVTLGAFQILENSQCSISGAGSSAVGSGNNLTLTLAMSFKPSYLGAKNVYAEAQNFYVQSGWQQLGTWMITAPQPPNAPSTPSPGDSATSVPINSLLSWTAGAGATWYDVYFGTSPAPPFSVSTAAINFSPGTLTPGTKYYWRAIGTGAAGSTSSPVWSFTTTLAATSVALSSSLNPAFQGQSVAFTAVLSPNTASGAVQFLDGSTALGTATINGGSAIFSTSSLAAGAHSITAVYGGDANSSPGTSAALIESVSKITSSVVLSSSHNPSSFGQPVTFTAKVSPGTASSTVQFLDGTIVLGTAILSNGSASIAVATLAVGTHSITAVYGGDSSYNSSTSGALAEVVNKAASAVAVSSSDNPSNARQPVMLTAVISPGTATGSVQFLERSTVLGTATVSAGSASVTTSALASGSHPISAVYSGSGNYTSSSAALTQVVKLATSTSLTSNRTAATYGQSVQFTATVSPNSSTGSVQFMDGSKSLGSGTLAGGAATLTLSTLQVGTHSVAAVYGGSAADSPSTSSARTVTITQADANIVVDSSVNPSLVGAAVKFTVKVTPGSATGTVKFMAGSTVLGTATLNAGSASLSTSTLSAGTWPITAVYSGDANYKSVTSSALSQKVNKSTSTTSIASSANPSELGQSVSFAASVSPPSASGTIQFLEGSVVLSTVTMSAGKAVWTMKPSSGSHDIKAVYSGDAGYLGSTSATVKQNVN